MRIIILFFLFLICAASYAQQSEQDQEQAYLEKLFSCSNEFGYSIDTMENQDLFERIHDWYGTDYCYGGNSKNGIDCSGFVSELYKDVYRVELAGNAADIYKQAHAIRKTELSEGDLVFFKIRKKRISHVGIYIGQNKFAHASTKHGVRVDDLNDPYYKKYFFRGGRMDARLSAK